MSTESKDRQSERQRMFNMIVEHMIKQNDVCVDEAGKCVYRNNGKRCAIGAVLSEEALKKLGDFKGGVSQPPVQLALEKSGWNTTLLTQGFLADAQYLLHDRIGDICRPFKEALLLGIDKFARRYSLQMPDVSKLQVNNHEHLDS